MQTTVSSVSYPVMEAFYTIQGEGFYQGHAAYFIRLGGCDVGCHWCDVKESWEADKHPKKTVEEMVREASGFPGRIAVITGGEPLMYDLTALTEALKEAGFRTHIETSGAYPLTGKWDWVCLSPKKFKEPVESIYPFVHELKAIIYNKSDFDFAEKHFQLIQQNQPAQNTTKFFLQPEWSKQQDMLPLIIDYVKNNPTWEVSLQVHKYMNIP
ncbi:MAG TPA: 7-carboxy-7-deazaguanine synthase QueE [Cytophagaceae bacterium]|nr:7-carboxy-7-deazaguanine synthase QueE [Cytophagaceae bacterium]